MLRLSWAGQDAASTREPKVKLEYECNGLRPDWAKLAWERTRRQYRIGPGGSFSGFPTRVVSACGQRWTALDGGQSAPR